MKKVYLTALILLFSILTFAQQQQERIFYIVDNVPIMDDPDETDELLNDDIENLEVVTSLDRIKALGYEGKVDKLFIITTKAFSKRSEELKQIPTTKIMVRKEGKWYINNSDIPYTGKFIDYYLSGKIQGDGVLKNGVIDGVRTVYFSNGNKRYFYTYENGVEHGSSEEYFINGKLKQKGSFDHKKEVGLWQIYYSTGKLKRQSTFVTNKQDVPKEELKFFATLDKGLTYLKDNDYSAAVRKLNEAILLNPNYSDTYLYRGTAKLNLFDFDNSIADFDKAIELEPLYMEAISNRAFARLRKFQFKDSRKLSSTSEVTILATKDNVQIPESELAKICADLKLGYSLGDRKQMILDAMKEYCK